MTELPKQDNSDSPQKEDAPTTPQKTISSSQLFDGEREVHIEHDGEVYRLRITRRNKLILQK
ncbi:MAG: hemin uptake protein HemP [Gemmataceae bacterium]